VHGYILVENQKMSKSKGNAIDPAELATTYGVDQVRYYLLRQLPITQDGSFTFQDLTDRINADLANSLGNLLNRSISLAHKYDLHTVAAPANWSAGAEQLRQKCAALFTVYQEYMDNGMFHQALAELWRFIGDVNAYFHATQPWKVVANDRALFEQIIAATCHALRSIGLMLWPIMPKKMEALLSAIGMPVAIGTPHAQELEQQLWNKTFTLTATEPLFTRIEGMEQTSVQPQVVAPHIDENQIGIEDFAKVELLAATITACEPVEGSKKLLKLQVDFGAKGMRQILSGVAEWFKPEDVIGKQVVFVANLKPRKMMGFDSQGMMLTAKDANGMRLISPAGAVENGTRLS
jgi:methionyl-tRNA synthetase